MDYIILGLLMSGPRTGYELQKLISVQMGLVCSASPGSVRAAISRLEKKGLAKVACPTGPRGKREISITKPGVVAFGEWLKEPMKTHGAKNIELAKLFFLDYAPEKHRISLIGSYLQDLRSTKQELEKIKGLAERPRNNTPSHRFPWHALTFGIDSAQFQIVWFERLLEQLESDNMSNGLADNASSPADKKHPQNDASDHDDEAVSSDTQN